MVLLKPEDATDVEDAVSRMLAPYSEHLEVPPYEKTCYCVGAKARADANKTAAEQVGPFDSLRRSFRVSDAETSEENDARWKEHIRPYLEAEAAALAAHPLHDKPDSECAECHGTGMRTTTYNPQSKWDWWRIGGRWDGVVLNLPEIPDGIGGFNFGATYQRPERNIATVERILSDQPEFSCFALVTPDGAWHERGEMGWFGVVHDEKPKDEWKTTIRTLLEGHSECIAVGVDCHI